MKGMSMTDCVGVVILVITAGMLAMPSSAIILDAKINFKSFKIHLRSLLEYLTKSEADVSLFLILENRCARDRD